MRKHSIISDCDTIFTRLRVERFVKLLLFTLINEKLIDATIRYNFVQENKVILREEII